MKLINVFRYLRGYIRLSLSGGFSERFINLCSLENIKIYDIQGKGKTVSASVKTSDFRRLRPIVRKSGVKVRIIEKKGLPFVLRAHKERVFFLYGFIFFIVFTLIMNSFIWFIDIGGSENVSDEEIYSFLEKEGLRTGSFVPVLDTYALSRSIVNHFNGKLFWASVNIRGSKASVELRDYVDERNSKAYEEPCNIVADRDGLILSAQIFNGDKEVTVGNAVKKGDLLISGVIEKRDMSCEYCEARGEITALTSKSFKREYTLAQLSGKHFANLKRGFEADIFSLRIPWFTAFYKNSIILEKKEQLIFDNQPLPFSLSSMYSCSITEGEPSQELLLYALDCFNYDFYREFSDSLIIENNQKVSVKKGRINFSCRLECIDYIGEKSPILIK